MVGMGDELFDIYPVQQPKADLNRLKRPAVMQRLRLKKSLKCYQMEAVLFLRQYILLTKPLPGGELLAE